jgi:N-acetylmuramoyl-L-alanine amidase
VVVVPPPVVIPVHTNLPPPPTVVQMLPLSTNEFTEAWVSLDRWSQFRGFGPFQKITTGTTASFAVRSNNFSLVFTSNSQIARCNGVEVHLGFKPQSIGGQLLINRLDLVKNIDPLLFEPASSAKHDRVVVIDPGHGGSNSGAKNVADARYEKVFTLDLALRLAPMLETNGWKVVLTRTKDVDVSLADRILIADQHHADLFVSLHFNSDAPSESEAGLETYCVTPVGMSSTLTRDYEDDISERLPNNDHDAENIEYAFKVQRSILQAKLLADRGVRRARFMGVLRGQKRAAVLVECGYLSNPAEAKKIADPEFRQKLAEAIARALK